MTTTVPLATASAGMQLAADLRDANGNVLLPQASVLTSANINALQRRGIASIEVMDTHTIDPAPPTAAEIALRVAYIFRRGGGNPNLQLEAAIHRMRLVQSS